MITKELFIEMISKVKEQEEIDSSIDKALGKVCGSWVMYNTENKLYGAFHKLLKTVMNDAGDTISWWIYESVEKTIWDKDKTWHLDTVEDLYYYLVENYKEI